MPLRYKRELKGKNAELRNDTDAELVLSAYRIWGENCPCHLLGDFAFAVWDVKQQKLFAARDHFGVKPFYYFSSKNYLAFASDEEAFLGLPDVSHEPNDNCIVNLLVPQFNDVDLERSWLKDIVKLPPGKTLSVERSGQKAMRLYWQLEPQAESRFASDLQCEEEFISIFTEAVRCRMRTLENPALMLSGGIDSAVVAVLAARALGPENVTGVLMPSVYTAGRSVDDARALAANLGIKTEFIPIKDIYAGFLKKLKTAGPRGEVSLTMQNLQARIRGTILMALANTNNWLALTTGNKSEIALGYCTLYGDTAGAIAPIADLLKTEVYQANLQPSVCPPE